jgi:hypothetical protein
MLTLIGTMFVLFYYVPRYVHILPTNMSIFFQGFKNYS